MSLPKGFVKINGTIRTATIWGITQEGAYIVDGKVEMGPMLATSIEFPYGRSDDFNYETQLGRWTPVFIPLKDVVSLNWECIGFLERAYGITKDWLREKGIKLYADGYGADIKQADIDAPSTEMEEERRTRFSRISPGVGDRKGDV